jgi:3-hydroxyethyl bacteriochlorophyllide a dehydrogenase
MDSVAIVLSEPENLLLSRLKLDEPGEEDVVVDIEWTGISTGTERLLWSGRMPPFPGMGYPLVPGYESVGRIASVGANADRRIGERVFVPGARCYGEVRGLFGGASSRIVVPAKRVTPVSETLGDQATMLALAATAYHVTSGDLTQQPDLIIGHGVLGRLIARVALAVGAAAPTVWETNATRRDGAAGYAVIDPTEDPRRDYRRICDVSGDPAILDKLIARLAPGGEIALAGFYSEPLSFAFPPAFMREARIRIAAEWRDADMAGTIALVDAGRLSLGGLITHRQSAATAPEAYRTAFNDAGCLKMILDWSGCS